MMAAISATMFYSFPEQSKIQELLSLSYRMGLLTLVVI